MNDEKPEKEIEKETDQTVPPVQEIANIPVVFIHYGFGELQITTAMPQIPAVNESVSFDSDDVPTGRVFAVSWVYQRKTQQWHAEVHIR
ncbi:hypothetical protein SEA_LABELLE_97 [Mycobacterium phage Labelle]|nr:hypothetical protein SEA_LABELLE_97 [Mycobacterium phage Labelle]